ncbi:TIGR01244 family sulfur transferase [Pseudoxanthomonas kalamensis]|uniref:TIGR01244 family sulfur transferase n=1 Tax=Pseudoxanthomonas kalamensis TaxID=289483 RepID=UPI001390D4D8|nr:TIGR01244 family sulfur transferase [Pseudoxanthomonas kalamensis]
MLSITPVSDTYHVCAQLHPQDVVEVARAGYATLICMRPDDEVDGQPAWADIAAQARRHGLDFHFIPARSGAVTPQQAARLREVMNGAPGRVLSYCASGNRCTLAWHMAMNEHG